jgi:hypothetical protein
MTARGFLIKASIKRWLRLNLFVFGANAILIATAISSKSGFWIVIAAIWLLLLITTTFMLFHHLYRIAKHTQHPMWFLEEVRFMADRDAFRRDYGI